MNILVFYGVFLVTILTVEALLSDALFWRNCRNGGGIGGIVPTGSELYYLKKIIICSSEDCHTVVF